jgi:hypothetical protein
LALWEVALHPLKDSYSCFPSAELKKKKSEIFSLHIPGFVASEENMDPIILVSLKTHHTPKLILWKSTSCIILVLPADKYVSIILSVK